MSSGDNESARLKIACVCGEEFSKLVKKNEMKGELVVVCPFCKAESKIVFGNSDPVQIFRKFI